LIKDYIYPYTNLDNGRDNGRYNGCYNGRRNERRHGRRIYKAQKLIDYKAGSCDYFKPICSPRPYMGSFNNFVKEGDCSTYKSPEKPCKSLSDHRINFLTKKVSDIRLRIYVCPLIDSITCSTLL